VPLRALTPPKNIAPELEPLIADFLDWARVERGFAAETITTYRRSLERFCTEATVLAVEHISLGDVLRFKRVLMNRGCSPSYIAGIILALRSFLGYCSNVLGRTVLNASAVKPPTRPRRTVTYLTPDEVQRFVTSIKIENRWSGRCRRVNENRVGLLYRSLVEVLLGTGLRISEALALRRSDIDWERQEARVVGKGGKERAVFFTERALDWLRRYAKRRPDAGNAVHVFVTESGEPLSRLMAGRWFRRQSQRAGLNKTVTAHVLRHTVATTLMFNGCPMGHIKEILGHERLDTTCRYYLGLDVRRAQAAHRQYLTYECAETGTSQN
jgi:site-specific recombinase XerD